MSYQVRVGPLLPKIESKQTSLRQCVTESWSSSWQMPWPSVPRDVKVETTNKQFDSGQESTETGDYLT